MSGSVRCPHTQVHYELNLASFGNTNIRYVEIKGACKLCDAPMVFQGRVGVSPLEPTVSLGGFEASLPVMFGDEEYDGRATGYSLSLGEVARGRG
jgi:hypothetical protein